MKWFGEQWPSAARPAPVCENLNEKIDPPVGDACLYCGEPIQADDQGITMPGVTAGGGYVLSPVHRVCLLKWTGINSIVEGRE